MVNGDEQCDGADLAGATCKAFGYYADEGLGCNPASCTYSTAGCQGGRCGDGERNGAEACDGADLGAETCVALGFYGEGTGLVCDALCGLDTSGCAGRCGDGVEDLGEECDDADATLGGQTCGSLGYYRGTARCLGGLLDIHAGRRDRGETPERQIEVPKGDPRDPMTEDEIAVKFNALGRDVVGEGRCNQIRQWIMSLENQQEMSGLFKLMQAA